MLPNTAIPLPAPAEATPPAPARPTPNLSCAPLSCELPPAPSLPLPPIPSSDRPLLARLFALNENYPALAAELATDQWNHLGDSRPKDLLDLYAWSVRPDIAAWIEHFRSMTDLQRRTRALTTLEEVIKSSPTPTERRRAATTILRALDRNWPAYRKPDREGGRPSLPATHTAPPPWSRSRERSTSLPVSRLPSPVSRPPSISPALQHSPTDLARAIATDLQDEFPEQALRTIAEVASPYADIVDEEVLESRLDTLPPLSDHAQTSDPVPFTPEPPLAEGQELTITDPQHAGLKLTLHFVRFAAKPWRLFDLNTG